MQRGKFQVEQTFSHGFLMWLGCAELGEGVNRLSHRQFCGELQEMKVGVATRMSQTWTANMRLLDCRMQEVNAKPRRR